MKENNKTKNPRVYIVKGSTGQYEDYHTWNAKAFLSKKKAKKFKAKCQEFVDWYFTKVSILDSYDKRDELGLSDEIVEYLEYLLKIEAEYMSQGELYDFDELVKEKSPDKNFYEDGLVNYSIEKVKLDLDFEGFNNDSNKYDFVVISKFYFNKLREYVDLYTDLCDSIAVDKK